MSGRHPSEKNLITRIEKKPGIACLIMIRHLSPVCEPFNLMKKAFLIGSIGGTFGLFAALSIILTSTSNEFTLSGVQAALFSSMGLMGAAITGGEPRFAGWMLISSSVWILITSPLAGTFAILYLYAPAIILLGVAGIVSLREPDPEEELTQ